MARWLGLVVSGTELTGVQLDCSTDPPELVEQFTWTLQQGDRVSALANLYQRLMGYVAEREIGNVVVKGSAVGSSRPTLNHLHSAELRGVAQVAARMAGAEVAVVQRAAVSKRFGTRKVDEYINDNNYWPEAVIGDLAKTRREAALLILSEMGVRR